MVAGDELPSGWVKATVGDVLALHYGKSLPAKVRDGGEFCVFGSNGIVGRHSEALIPGPAIIVGRKGSIGRVHMSSEPCWPIDTTYYVSELHGQPPGYWLYRLQGLHLASLDRASAIPGLNRDDVYAQPLGLPPLNEQRRIVAKLDSLQERREAAKEALDAIPPLLARFRQSVLAAAFRGDLTRDWREQNPDVEPASALLERIRQERKTRFIEDTAEKARAKAEAKARKAGKPWTDADDAKVLERERGKALKKYREPDPVQPARLSTLPEGWCWASFGQVFDVAVGATPARKVSAYWGGGIPWVSSGEVAFCRISATKETITPEGFENTSTELHPPGTVLLGMIGEGKTRGQAAILDVPASHNQNSAAIRVSEAGIPPEYVYLFLQAEYVSTRRVGSGNNQPALNKSRVQQMLFPVPSIEEMRMIVGRLESRLECVASFDDARRGVNENFDTLDQSVLATAFRGELVPQDPSDEAASELLKRIREQADSAPRAPKVKRARKRSADT